ncbi:MAG: HAMP domain-containing histidine kinase [Dorea sp.]|jgi:signal transduction histidine kinase|nr:HAMP domain-containing histidine kinase [Dorea sp.]
MNIWIGLLIIGLLIIIGILFSKVYLLKKSAKEINIAFAEKIKHDTNTLIQISSHDTDMRALAASINMQLKVFNNSRQKYEHGDLELKEAITNISHDLRTPLTAIYGYLNLLRDEECSKTARVYLSSIENRTKAMKQLTEELFQYTLTAADTEDMIIETVNLNAVLENIISSYYSVLKQKNIIPKITIPDKKTEGKGNENALSRVLGNIINNAVKYSDGDLNITLTQDREFFFSNHASGLTEIQIERLFDRFYTVNSARKSTGLGLSISKILMEKMGGTISADYENEILTICISVPG